MPRLRGTLIGLVLLASAAPARAESWTVDDDGPADFASIASAVAEVAAGDTLLVMPGHYQGFVLTRTLTILGSAGAGRPWVHGQTRVEGASSVTLAGLHCERLVLLDVPGPALVDDCVVGRKPSADYPSTGKLSIDHCAQVIVTGCLIDANGSDGHGVDSAVYQASSDAVFVACTILGGNAYNSETGYCGKPGRSAMIVFEGSAQLTDCFVRGGGGGITGCFSWPSDGDSGDGLYVDDARIDLRPGTLLEAGTGDPLWAGELGYAARLTGTKTEAVLGGAVVGIGGLWSGTGVEVIEPTVPEPTLLLAPGSSSAPGGSGSLSVGGPVGAQALLVASLQFSLTQVPAVEGPLWPALPAMLIAPLVVGAPPLDYTLPSDPGLIGTVLAIQAVLPDLPAAKDPGLLAATNPAQIIIRH